VTQPWPMSESSTAEKKELPLLSDRREGLLLDEKYEKLLMLVVV